MRTSSMALSFALTFLQGLGLTVADPYGDIPIAQGEDCKAVEKSQ